jgi:hypothetical protein
MTAKRFFNGLIGPGGKPALVERHEESDSGGTGVVAIRERRPPPRGLRASSTIRALL